jgi:hypothetical protein
MQGRRLILVVTILAMASLGTGRPARARRTAG